MNTRRKAIAGSALAGALFLTVGLAAPANAHPHFGDGLVNVVISDINLGDITIAEDVNVGIAANIAANVCGTDVKVGPIVVLGIAVDRSGDSTLACTATSGPVSLVQN